MHVPPTARPCWCRQAANAAAAAAAVAVAAASVIELGRQAYKTRPCTVDVRR